MPGSEYSYPQLAVVRPAKAPGQNSIGTGGQYSLGRNIPVPKTENSLYSESGEGENGSLGGAGVNKYQPELHGMNAEIVLFRFPTARPNYLSNLLPVSH
jgi:hypothetical protein